MPNGIGENVAVLDFVYHAGGRNKATNSGLWGRAPGELALPGGCFLVQFLAKSQNDYIYRSKGKNDISDIDDQPAGKK
jgi:hypothetical protein